MNQAGALALLFVAVVGAMLGYTVGHHHATRDAAVLARSVEANRVPGR